MLTRTGGATSKWERDCGITMATYYNFSFHNKKNLKYDKLIILSLFWAKLCWAVLLLLQE